jgi:hypothetical protein
MFTANDTHALPDPWFFPFRGKLPPQTCRFQGILLPQPRRFQGKLPPQPCRVALVHLVLHLLFPSLLQSWHKSLLGVSLHINDGWHHQKRGIEVLTRHFH